MQSPILSLKEIIWEITSECNNACSYCGSKEHWNKKTDPKTILAIADEIAKYPPEEIDISGGDPLLVDYMTHQQMVTKLKTAGVKAVKILVNPKSLITEDGVINIDAHTVLNLYDWIGLSLNTEKELNLALTSCVDMKELMKRVTIVTNFNTTNLHMFPYLKEFVLRFDLAWQIQMTMIESPGMAIYKSNLAFNALEKYIQDAVMFENVKIIPADNLNSGRCGAGTMSLGILSNGDIVPCLSMRSWHKDVNSIVVANILAVGNDDDIEPIGLEFYWKHKFTEQRFGEFHCCKDECGNRCVNLGGLDPKPGGLERATGKTKEEWDRILKNIEDAQTPPFPDTRNRAVMYAVSPRDQVMAYAVAPYYPSETSVTPVYSVKMNYDNGSMKMMYGVAQSELNEIRTILYAVIRGEDLTNSSNTTITSDIDGVKFTYNENEICNCTTPTISPTSSRCQTCNKIIRTK